MTRRITVLSVIFIVILINPAVSGQEQDGLETRVAFLLKKLPADNARIAYEIFEEMSRLGYPGLDLLCRQVIPAGQGDDHNVRYAVSGLSVYLSAYGDIEKRLLWEQLLIERVKKTTDPGLVAYFIEQLHYVGSDASLACLSHLLDSPVYAGVAVEAVVAIGGNDAAGFLLKALDSQNLQDVAQVLNGLVAVGSVEVTPGLISMASSTDTYIKAAAYRALAATGSSKASDLLLKAAAEASYRNNKAGAMASLLTLAGNMGTAGNVKGMEKILRAIDKNSHDIHYKTAVLNIRADVYGSSINKQLLKAMRSDNQVIRGAAMKIASGLESQSVTHYWLSALKKFKGKQAPEIVAMLGERKDRTAVPALMQLLNDEHGIIRQASALSLGMIEGKEAVPVLLDYLLKYHDGADQETAAKTLITILDKDQMPVIAQKLKAAKPVPASTLIGLLAWSGLSEYFDVVLPFADSDDEGVKTAAIMALKSLSTVDAQAKLIDMLEKADNRHVINELQTALVASVADIDDADLKTESLLGHMERTGEKTLIIPVLSRLGGRKAAWSVYNEFESGDAVIRDICFEALMFWSDQYALDPLFEICNSGNKRFGDLSYKAFVGLIDRVSIPGEQKLLYIRKIFPLAQTIEQKESLINSASTIPSYGSCFFVAQYLADEQLAITAAKSVLKIVLPQSEEKEGLKGSMIKKILTSCAAVLDSFQEKNDRDVIIKYLSEIPEEDGFTPLFNGTDTKGWALSADESGLYSHKPAAGKILRFNESGKGTDYSWKVVEGVIAGSESRSVLHTTRGYYGFELMADWRIHGRGNGYIYIHGPHKLLISSETGIISGGLYNGTTLQAAPSAAADNATGEWNTVRVLLVADRLSVWINGILVIDNLSVWNKLSDSDIFPSAYPLGLQISEGEISFRDIYLREILSAWQLDTAGGIIH